MAIILFVTKEKFNTPYSIPDPTVWDAFLCALLFCHVKKVAKKTLKRPQGAELYNYFNVLFLRPLNAEICKVKVYQYGSNSIS